MSPPDQPVDKLQVAVQGDTAIIRVIGRGSFKISSTLKEFAHAVIDHGCMILLLDMADCIGMDSTFMGVLAGLAFRLQNIQGRIVMVNLSLRTRGLLSTLGLDEVIEPHMTGDMPAEFQVLVPGRAAELETLANPERSTRATAETMLEAHQDLVRLSPGNLPKFKDVLAFLQEDLKKSDPGRQTSS